MLMRSSWHKSKVYRLFLLLCLAGWMSGCEEYREGCMDAAAVNFKADHQKPCCCEYPSLILQTTLTDEDGTVSFADTLTNETGQRYTIRNMRFIFSEVVVQDSLGRTYQPIDTFGQSPIRPDITAVNVKNLNNKGGEILANETFNRLYFSLKDLPGLQDRKPASFPSDHPLRDSSFFDFNSDRWIVAQVNIGLEDGRQKNIRLYGEGADIRPVIENRWTKELGKDLVINFKINVRQLFGKMNFENSENQLREEFKANLPAAFEP